MDARSHWFALLAVAILSLFNARLLAATIGPLPYNDLRDSPFDLSRRGIDFFVEDFAPSTLQDLSNVAMQQLAYFTTPGLIEKTGNAISVFGNNETGVLMGLGRITDWEHGERTVELSFEFDTTELGKLPQAVGFVISNGRPITCEFAAINGHILATLQSPAVVGIGDTLQANQQNRFLGAIFADGISRVTISSPGSWILLDDFQYGQLAPEPSTVLLALISLVVVLSQGRSRPFSGSDISPAIDDGSRSPFPLPPSPKQNQPPWCIRAPLAAGNA